MLLFFNVGQFEHFFLVNSLQSVHKDQHFKISLLIGNSNKYFQSTNITIKSSVDPCSFTHGSLTHVFYGYDDNSSLYRLNYSESSQNFIKSLKHFLLIPLTQPLFKV